MNAADWLSQQEHFSATEISADAGLVGKILMWKLTEYNITKLY